MSFNDTILHHVYYVFNWNQKTPVFSSFYRIARVINVFKEDDIINYIYFQTSLRLSDFANAESN